LQGERLHARAWSVVVRRHINARTRGARVEAGADLVLRVARQVAVAAVIICTELPISLASSKIEMPAASASVANVWRRWYGPRLAIPAASSAGYHSRLRQLFSSSA
jgi:hypothetical protein